MQCIEAPVIESVLEFASDLDAEQASEEMMKFATAQPDVLGFTNAFSEELREEAQEVLIFLTFVIYRVFETAAADPIPTISPEAIVAKYEDNQSLIVGLDEKDDTSFEELASLETANQPHLFGYITEALLEEDDPNDDIELDDEEFGEIFMLLKTIIDVIDAETN